MSTVNDLALVNQFGEESFNQVVSVSAELAALIYDEMTPADITSTPLTGLAAGSNTPITATDTILEALANLQAQIDAL